MKGIVSHNAIHDTPKESNGGGEGGDRNYQKMSVCRIHKPRTYCIGLHLLGLFVETQYMSK